MCVCVCWCSLLNAAQWRNGVCAVCMCVCVKPCAMAIGRGDKRQMRLHIFSVFVSMDCRTLAGRPFLSVSMHAYYLRVYSARLSVFSTRLHVCWFPIRLVCELVYFGYTTNSMDCVPMHRHLDGVCLCMSVAVYRHYCAIVWHGTWFAYDGPQLSM